MQNIHIGNNLYYWPENKKLKVDFMKTRNEIIKKLKECSVQLSHSLEMCEYESKNEALEINAVQKMCDKLLKWINDPTGE